MTETHILNYLSAGSAMDSFCFVLFRFKFLFSSFILYDLPNYQFLQLSSRTSILLLFMVYIMDAIRKVD